MTVPAERTDGEDSANPSKPAGSPATSAELDAIFGNVLPDITADERDPGPGDPARSDHRESGYSEQWYRENRPPHHE